MHWQAIAAGTCLALALLGWLASGGAAFLTDVALLLLLLGLVGGTMAALWVWLGAWRDAFRDAFRDAL